MRFVEGLMTMNVNRKHDYRFVYLHSEEWKNVRTEALARENAKCQLCGFKSTSNDAHHVWYPSKLWDTSAEDLIILCRDCHELVHQIITIQPDRGTSFRAFKIIIDAIKEWHARVRPEDKTLSKPLDLSKNLGSTSSKIAKEERSKCQVCTRIDIPVYTHNIMERYGITNQPNFYWRMCKSCLSSFQFTLDLPENHSVAFRFIRPWKMAREKEAKDLKQDIQSVMAAESNHDD